MISHVGFLHERLVFGRRVSILTDWVAKLVPKGARVLDVGCGPTSSCGELTCSLAFTPTSPSKFSTDRGDREAICLLNGVAMSTRSWYAFVPQLQRSARS